MSEIVSFYEIRLIADELSIKSLLTLCETSKLISYICEEEPYVSRIRNYKEIMKRREKFEEDFFKTMDEFISLYDESILLFLHYYIETKIFDKKEYEFPKDLWEIIKINSRELFSSKTPPKISENIHEFIEEGLVDDYLEILSDHMDSNEYDYEEIYLPLSDTLEYNLAADDNMLDFLSAMSDVFYPGWLYGENLMTIYNNSTHSPIELMLPKEENPEFRNFTKEQIKEIESMYFE